MLALLLLATGAAQAVPQDTGAFRHLEHARLFVSCTTCHAGIASGRAADIMPAATSCRACHDGTTERVVAWSGARIAPSNLRFEHRSHADRVRREGDSALSCVACHAQPRAGVFMDAGRAEPMRCFGCHAHSAPEGHLAAPRCTSCHVAIRDAPGLPPERISALPKPPSHQPGYVFAHARDAGATSCQVCHSRESCASCHVNAGRLTEIAALENDPRVATLIAAGAPVRYPTPASHDTRAFATTHGALATARGATCASCHARQSCLGCHRSDERLPAVTQLPSSTGGGAPGVELADRRPPDHGSGFAWQHRAAAATGASSCASCHTQQYCTACHNAATASSFHLDNFVQRHASAAYGADTECSSCHQVTVFCAGCHRQTGVVSRDALPAGKFHTGVANWTFAHGGVARRSLETCAACHTQNSCTQCHSATRGWRVNPHGARPPGGNRSAPMCRYCHG